MVLCGEMVKVPELMLNDDNFSYFVFQDLMLTLDITKSVFRVGRGGVNIGTESGLWV